MSLRPGPARTILPLLARLPDKSADHGRRIVGVEEAMERKARGGDGVTHPPILQELRPVRVTFRCCYVVN
jgi:hypothetical protein